MILIDSNIPMYLVGAPHSCKTTAERLLNQLASDGQRLVTDAEVFQEILHRYVAINRRDGIQPAFDVLLRIVDEIFPIDQSVVDGAKQVVLGYRRLSLRDGIHVAVMQHHGIAQILSFDSGFDAYPGIKRIF